MADSTRIRNRDALSTFLVQQRNRLTPADVGLPAGGRRRTAGLRREEVAALAGVGLTWYTWFEQGREIRVSESFLLGVARALRLDDAQCSHLFHLAHRRPPPPEAHQSTVVGPLTQRLLDELPARPAYVMNLRWDVVAWNAAADALFDLGGRPAGARNILRMVFADPEMRPRLPAWREDAPGLLAQFRYHFAVAPDDPAMQALVADLGALSPDFRRWWKAPSGEVARHGTSAVLGAAGERLDYVHETLLVDEHRHLRLVVYFPAAPG